MSTPNGGERASDPLSDSPEPSLVSELIDFLKHNKKWWLVPIFVVLAIFGVIAALASTSVAPFIYTLF